MIWLRALPRQLPHCIPHQYRLTNLSTYLAKSLNTSWQICESAVRLILSDYLVYNPPHCITTHCYKIVAITTFSLYSKTWGYYGGGFKGVPRYQNQIEVAKINLFFLSKPQLNHNSNQHEITLVGLDMKMTLHTTPTPPTTHHPQKLNVSNISAVTYLILMKL